MHTAVAKPSGQQQQIQNPQPRNCFSGLVSTMADSGGASRRPFLMLKELVDRELHYLKCLQALLYLILQPLKDASLVGKPIISHSDIEKIFSNNLNSFLSISQALFFELLHLQERAEEDVSCVKEVGAIFQKQGDLLKCYYGYAPQVHAQIQFINELTKKNAKWDAFLKEKYLLLRSKNIHDDFVSLLVRPSRQAVLYLQFLEGFVKELGDIEPLTGGLTKLKEVLAHVGKTKAGTAAAPTTAAAAAAAIDQTDPEVQKLHNLQKRIIGRIRVVEQGRSLVLQESFVVLEEKRKKEVHLVLFNDALFIGAPYDDKILLERFLPLSLVSLTAEEAAEKPVLKLTVFGYTYMLLASSHRSRVNWLTKLADLAEKKQQQLEAAQAKAAERKSRAYSSAELISEFTSVVADYPRMLVQLVGKLNPKTKAFEEPQGTNATYVVSKYGAIIGRDLEANEKKALILITDDDNISRRKPGRAGHAEIDFKEDFRLWDLGSSNNTYILDSATAKVLKKLSPADGSPTTDPFALKEGTLFQLGGTRFKVTRVELSPLDSRLAGKDSADDEDDPSWGSIAPPGRAERGATDSPARTLSPGRSRSPPRGADSHQMLKRAVSINLAPSAAVEKAGSPSGSSNSLSSSTDKPLMRGNGSKGIQPNVGMRTIRASANALGLVFAAAAADDDSADSVADLLLSKAQEKEKNRKRVLFDGEPSASASSGSISPHPSSESSATESDSSPAVVTTSPTGDESAPSMEGGGGEKKTGSWLASERVPIGSVNITAVATSPLVPLALGSARAGDRARSSYGPDEMKRAIEASSAIAASSSTTESAAAGGSSPAPLRSSGKRLAGSSPSFAVPSAPPPAPPPNASVPGVSGVVSAGGSAVRSPRARVLQLLVKDANSEPIVRGRVSLTDRSTILSLRTEIFDTLLDDTERAKLRSGADQLPLKIGGKVPLRPQQNSQFALSLIMAEDTELVVELSNC